MQLKNVQLNFDPSGSGKVKFLRAEVPTGQYYSPFALIRYTLQGVEQNLGLRLDMDKRVFLDHFEDEEKEGVIRKAAPKIVELVGAVLYSR
jgi:hypothetical protein